MTGMNSIKLVIKLLTESNEAIHPEKKQYFNFKDTAADDTHRCLFYYYDYIFLLFFPTFFNK